jgi:hypothetical protein
MNAMFQQFLGSYTGAGYWVDETAVSKRYTIEQSCARATDGLAVQYVHDLYEENSKVQAELIFRPNNSMVFTVVMNAREVGHGYVFGDFLHFHIQLGPVFVEASYHVAGDKLLVRGSSTKNAQGNFICWLEALVRVADGPASVQASASKAPPRS